MQFLLCGHFFHLYRGQFLIKREIPALVVEIFSVGSSQYETRLHLYEDPSADVPVPYHVNAAVLEHVAAHARILADDLPAYRFAITGECVSYRTCKGEQVNLPLEPPNTSPALTAVFDQAPSHLVLLIDKNEPIIPGQTPLPWIAAGVPKVPGFVDQSELLDIASEIVSVQGTVTRQADLWLVLLNGNQLRVEIGEIPPELRVECNSTNGKDIGCNFYDLIRVFSRRSISTNTLEEIALKELSSTDEKKTNVGNRTEFVSTYKANLVRVFEVEVDDIQFTWLGNEAIAIRVEKVSADRTRHPLPASSDDKSYRPCEADAVIQSCVPANCPVSSVIHAPCTSVSIYHYHGSGWSQDQFQRAVDRIRDEYGFLVSWFGPYRKSAATETGKLGEMSIEVCDAVVAISLVQTIAAQIPIDAGFDAHGLLMIARTMAAPNLAARRRGLDERIGPLPSFWTLDKLKFRDLLKMRTRYEGRPLCMNRCGIDEADSDDVIPHPTPVFDKFGDPGLVWMCRSCVQISLTVAVVDFFNPSNRTIVQNRLAALRARLPPLPAYTSEVDAATNQHWPAIPLGVLVWAFVSDRNGVAAYAKAWVTGVAETTVRCAGNLFTNCPNHPQFLLALPTAEQAAHCEHCNMFLCGICRTWHELDNPCDNGEIAGAKRCPRCRTPVFKTSGCNHIACKCGCNWCYKCTQGFDLAADCYTHMRTAHRGISVDPWR
jgi:hypothetical protein